jgi:diacylglycerol kinase family enzyme
MGKPQSPAWQAPAGYLHEKRTVAILNLEAGSLAQKSTLANKGELDLLFRGAGIREIRMVKPARFSDTVQREVDAGAEVIGGGGGDGTVNSAARWIHGTPVVLGVLPLGTLNHFSQSLGMPPDLEAAVHALDTAIPEPVDIGEVNESIFVNNSSIGIYAKAVLWREQVRSKLGIRKYWAMAFAIMRLFWSFPVYDLVIEEAGKRDSARTPFLFVGNNRYQPEFLSTAKRESLSDGCLSVYYGNHLKRLWLMKVAIGVLLGAREIADLQVLEAAEVTVTARRHNLHVAIDGEIRRMRSPLRFRILPRSLHVLRTKAT